MHRSACKKPVILVRFSPHISEIYSNIKLHEDPANESQAVPRGRTDGRTDRQI